MGWGTGDLSLGRGQESPIFAEWLLRRAQFARLYFAFDLGAQLAFRLTQIAIGLKAQPPAFSQTKVAIKESEVSRFQLGILIKTIADQESDVKQEHILIPNQENRREQGVIQRKQSEPVRSSAPEFPI